MSIPDTPAELTPAQRELACWQYIRSLKRHHAWAEAHREQVRAHDEARRRAKGMKPKHYRLFQRDGEGLIRWKCSNCGNYKLSVDFFAARKGESRASSWCKECTSLWRRSCTKGKSRHRLENSNHPWRLHNKALLPIKNKDMAYD